MKKLLSLLFAFLFFANLSGYEKPINPLTGVYITGIGCPNCAETDPYFFGDILEENPFLILFEYEIYKQAEDNRDAALKYFSSYYPNERAGVPCVIFNPDNKAVGRFHLMELAKNVSLFPKGSFPMPDGTIINFNSLNLNDISGLPKIWHRNRIMFYSGSVNEKQNQPESSILKKILLSSDIEKTLKTVKHQKIEPFPIELSKGSVVFDKGAKVGDWNIFWKVDEKEVALAQKLKESDLGQERVGFGFKALVYAIAAALLFLGIIYFVDRRNMIKKGTLDPMTEEQKNFMVLFISGLILAAFFFAAQKLSPEFLSEMGYKLPLPLFTFIVAIVDGFNPCNMFVLTFLMALIVSASHSRLRIYIVGYTFVAVVYVIYYLFMAAWLNIFKYIGFIDPLRITIAIIAIIAGLINCKELIFFKKGVTLTTSDAGMGFLQKKTRKVRDVIKNGSIPVLILSSITLASFSSLIELPCTAGFPIIYTTVLSGLEIPESSFIHYFWIAMYNLVYIIPLAVIIFIFGYTFKGKAISEQNVQRMKFIGGFIMLALGIVLLVNPALVGIGFAG
ncbi:MAG: hypothetical protein ACOX2F_00275 [bacterium]